MLTPIATDQSTKTKNIIAVALLVMSGFFVIAAMYLSLKISSEQARATDTVTIDVAALAPESQVTEHTQTTQFSLYANTGYLYKSQGTGLAAAVDFISKDPTAIDTAVLGAATGRPLTKKVRKQTVPHNFLGGSFLTRKQTDATDTFLTKAGFHLNGEHYYFRQKIGAVPVFAGGISVHLRNGGEVYAMSGNVSLSTAVSAATVSASQAEKTALAAAVAESSHSGELKTVSSTEVIVNKRILGLSDDENNYPSQEVTVVSAAKPPRFARRYFISLHDGGVLLSENLLESVLDRGIYSCAGGSTTCNLVRQEGESVSNDRDVDDTYKALGDSYNYYSQGFHRDSYDNAGASLDAFTHLTTQIDCPNAFWSGAPDDMFAICDGMAGEDVLAHEYTHAITEHTASLMHTNQGGALNEAMSDIFAYAVDPGNWTMGETTTLGVIRHGDDPTKDAASFGGPHPDRLFSPNYYCKTGDDGGVHQNMSVMVKGYYLMVVGGSFNGCQITAIGRQNASAIYYRALTTYMQPTTNFRGAYSTLMQACGDLYQPNSAICLQVQNSLQATEIDQQPDNTQTGAVCSNVSPHAPACAATVPTATPTRLPSSVPTATAAPTGTGNPTSTPTRTPTPGISANPTATRVPTSGPTATTIPTAVPTAIPTATPTPTVGPTSTPKPTPTPPPITADSIILNLKLRFQGLLLQPKAGLNTMLVHVGIRHLDENEALYGDGTFTADPSGVWTGRVIINGTAPADDFTVYVKGPKHIQKKICTAVPHETYTGTYTCATAGAVRLTTGNNQLDFSGIAMLAGDLPVQDGIANSYDLSTVRNLLGRTDAEALDQADVNLDGIVDSQDYSLVLSSLAFRFDETTH